MFDMKISDENREQWRPEQLEILTHIARCGTEFDRAGLHSSASGRFLWWHRGYSASDDVRDKADAIVASIPESFELRLAQELMDPFHSRDMLPEEREGDDGYRRQQERIEQTQRALIAEFLSHSGDAGKGVQDPHLQDSGHDRRREFSLIHS